jgi:ATP-binding cassette subfamily B protein
MHFGGIHEDQIVGRAFDRVLMKRFYLYLAPYRWQAVAVLALLPLVAGATLAQPWLVKLAIDRHIVAGKMEGMPLLTFWYLLLIIGESLLSYLEVWLLQFMGQRIMHDIRLELFSHVQRLPASFFDRMPTGNLVTRLTSDVEVLGEMFAAGIVTVVGDIIVLFGIVVIMVWMNLKLSLVTFTVLPLLVWIAFAFRRKMREAYREVRSRLANLNAFLAESIGGMNVVQLFNRQKSEQREFTILNASYREANLPVITWDASLYAMVETLSSVAVGLLIW